MKTLRLRRIVLALALAGIVQAHASELDTARGLADKHDYTGAIPLYERALANEPNDSDLMIELAQVYGWADRNKDSAALYRQVADKHPTRRGDVISPLAWQTMWAGDAAASVPLFKEAVKHDRRDVESAIGLAEAMRESGDDAGALKQLDTLLTANPKQVRALNARGSLHLDRGANELALNDFASVLRSAPDDVDARVGRAKVLDDAARHREAVADYRKLRAQLPKDEGVTFRLARSMYWAGAEPEALDALKGLSIPEATQLRDKIRRDHASRVGAGYEISSDSDGLRTQAAIAEGRKLIGATGALDASYRSTWLDGLGVQKSLTVASAAAVPTTPPNIRTRIRGDQLAVGWSDRFGGLDSANGMLFPRLSVGARDYAGWKSPLVKAGARWLSTDSWRYDFEGGNEIVETVDGIHNRVRFDYLSAGFDHSFAPRWSLGAGYLHGRFNDGVSRDRVTSALEYTLKNDPNKWTVGLEGLLMRDTRQAVQDVTNVIGGSGGPTDTFQIAGRGYYNPKRYWELKPFTTYGIDRDKWSFWGKLAVGGLGETNWDGTRNSGLYTFGELNGAYWFTPSTDLKLVAGRSGSRISATESGGYHRSYGGLYLTSRF